MSYSVSGTTITLTRGDTFVALISITKQDGTPYVPNDGDKVRFAMKAKYEDPEPLVVKDIPIDTLTLTLHPEDTKGLSFGKYVYDIQLTKADGTVDTFITKATIKITEEVDEYERIKSVRINSRYYFGRIYFIGNIVRSYRARLRHLFRRV